MQHRSPDEPLEPTIASQPSDDATLRQEDAHPSRVAPGGGSAGLASRYRSSAVLGVGGMGEVALCRDEVIGNVFPISTMVVVVPTFMVVRTRDALARAERRLLLQAWRLRQMLPRDTRDLLERPAPSGSAG